MYPHRAGMVAIIRITTVLALLCVCMQSPGEGHPLQKCYMSKYKKIPTSIIQLARALQNQQQKKPHCHLGLQLRNQADCDIMGKERLSLTLERLKLVIGVLERINNTELVIQNLEAFSILQEDLMNCTMATTPELKKCERHLNRYRKTVTEECLKNDVLLSLVWFLVEDVSYVVHGKQSAEKMEKVDLRVTAKPPAAKKPKGKRRNKTKKSKKNNN